MDLSPALHIPTDAGKGNSLVSLQTLYIPWKHKLAFRLRYSQKHQIPSTLWAPSNFPAITWLICQAQRKFLTFNQATHTLSFLYLFTRIAPPLPPLSLFVLSNHQKSASLSFTELLLLSRTLSHPSILPFCSTPSFPIKFFPPFPPFRRINAAPLLFIVRAAFTPAHPLT